MSEISNPLTDLPAGYQSLPQRRQGSLPPLGIMMVCRTKPAWHDAPPAERPELDDPLRLSRACGSEARIYRVYGFDPRSAAEQSNGAPPTEEAPQNDERWEFVYVLEAADLEEWNELQARFEEPGFSDFFECDTLAFGRRLS